jgi:hypothetical protein
MFGLLPFSENALSTDQLDTLFLLSGVVATGEVGTVAVSGVAVFSVTGVSGTAELGLIDVSAAAVALVAGVAGTGDLGTVSITGTANVVLVGVEGTSALGTVTVAGQSSVVVSGVQSLAELGFEFAYGWNDPNWSEIGLVGEIEIDEIAVFSGHAFSGVPFSGRIRRRIRNNSANWGNINDNQTPNWAQIIT